MKQRKICIITGTRAEYGLLYRLLRAIKDDKSLKLQIIASGTHLSKEFGLTYKQIIKDGFIINKKVRSIFYSQGEISLARSIAIACMGFEQALKKLKPDIVVILGDRYEMFAAAVAAYTLQIPIAHIHGGEVTAGVLDEAFRHSITKMAYLHFPCIKQYADRIIRMGESPRRVFVAGALGIENIKRLNLLSKSGLEKALNFRFKRKTAVITYHPETLGKVSSQKQIKELLEAINPFKMDFIFTSPGAEAGSGIIREYIKKYVKKNKKRAEFFDSLGQIRYLSLLKYADLMIGNSSSGIIEAPSFRLPVVNIGDRQKQRYRCLNILDCKCSQKEIKRAIKKALSTGFRNKIAKVKSPFGKGETSAKIKKMLKTILLDKDILKKEFYEKGN
jgi:UDP-hydrolysing UDP-N-acetyl-D-glucosamine 2-epimerase